MLTLNQLVAKAVNVDVEAYESLLTRGTKPTKALFRLGVDQQLAGMIGTLKIATTAEEINEVYANEGVKSCMTGLNVGEFYNFFNISVIYNDRYRCLVNLKKEWKSSRGYGILCYQLDDLLSTVLTGIVNDITEFKSETVMTLKYSKAASFHRHMELPRDMEIPWLDDFGQGQVGRDIFYYYGCRSKEEERAFFNARIQIICEDSDEDILLPLLDLSRIYESQALEEEYEKTLRDYYETEEVLKFGTYKGTMGRGIDLYHHGDWYYFYCSGTCERRSHESEVERTYIRNGYIEIEWVDDLPF